MTPGPAHYHSQPGKFMPRILVHALHGTFQTPDVWEGLEASLVSALAGTTAEETAVRLGVDAVDVEPPATGGLVEWAARFCRGVGGRGPIERDAGDRRVLLGYSLGGRLALHALLRCPATWDAAVVVAAHTGSGDAAERAVAGERDARWAARCRAEALAPLLAEWDALPVFGGRPNRAPRVAGRLDPERCARMFEAFSRAGQEDLEPALAKAAAAGDLPPILYVTGAGDEKYADVGRRLAGLVRGVTHLDISGAGHRVPWDRPERFVAGVADFLRYRLGEGAPSEGT